MMRKLISIMVAALALSTGTWADGEWQVNRIVHDENCIYVGTESLGVVAINKQTGEQKQYVSQRWEGYHQGITDLAWHDGQLYTINKNYYLGILSGDEMRYEPINVNKPDPQRYIIPRLAWSPNGILWTNHYTNLVMHMGRATFVGKWEAEPEGGPYFVSEEVIRSIAIDKDGVVWFGCAGNSSSWHNFVRFSPKEGTSFPGWDNTSNLGNSLNEIKIDEEGNKWIAAYYGLGCYDKEENAVLYKLVGDKRDLCLLDDGRILVPNNGHLYIFQNGEFSLLCEHASGKTILSVDADDGVYYFGTEEGLFKYENGKVEQIPLLSQTVEVKTLPAPNEAGKAAPVYDLQGRRVATTAATAGGKAETSENGDAQTLLPKGIYVTEGRKILAQ